MVGKSAIQKSIHGKKDTRTKRWLVESKIKYNFVA